MTTLKTLISELTKAVEQKVAADLPDSFGLVIDGWSFTSASTHYLPVFAVYQDENQEGRSKLVLLAFSPLLDDEDLGAKSHVDFITTALGYFNKTVCNVGFLVCDNENLNGKIAIPMGIPMIGCYSHRLNLAVEKFSEPYNEIISKLHNIMKKLGNLEKSAALRKKTDLRPILHNETRWSSKHAMLKRYKVLKPFIDSMDAEIAQILPTSAEDIDLGKLYQSYFKFESTSKTLQQEKNSIDLSDSRELFDSLIEQIGK